MIVSLNPCRRAVCLALAILLNLPLVGRAAAAEEPDRSPVDLVLGPGEQWLATANQTSGTVSLIRLPDGKVLDERTVGERPEAIELAADGKTLLVSCSYAGTVEILRVHDGQLEPQGCIVTGMHPHGIAADPDGRTAYVALCAADTVGVLDLTEKSLTKQIPVGRWPRYLALSPDGKRLAVGTSGDRGMTIVDTQLLEEVFRERFMGLNIGHVQVSRDGRHAYFPWMVYRHNPVSPQNIRLGWVLASRIARVQLDESARREALSLDPPGRAVADPFGLRLTSDETRLVVSASGTHELLVLAMQDLPLLDHGGTDHLPAELREAPERFDRIVVGGRPMGLRIAADDRTVYVANYLHNSIQVVDLDARKVRAEWPLGGPAEPSLARRGEAIFFDAGRSLDQWYSCHSCHYQGGINSERMDTENDGSRFTFKTVLPLYQLPETGPWTWHGWQTDLEAAMHKSLTSTMQGPEPSAADVEALLAYFSSLRPPPNPFRSSDNLLSDAAARGKVLFHSDKAACIQCHNGPFFTDGQLHDVGLGSPGDRYPTFNTPTLINVYQKTQLLHDGRASSLDELLLGPHNPRQVAGEGELTDDERHDLIEYLKTL